MTYMYFTFHRISEKDKKFIEQLQNESYLGNTSRGDVEEDNMNEIFGSKFYCYGKVMIGANEATLEMKANAVKYAKKRSSPIWPVVKEDGTISDGHRRPFDYLSPWVYDSKQMDEYTPEEVLNNPSLAKTLDYGYYCSEIVWAAWEHAGINLDGNGGAVWPWEIKGSRYVKIYYNSTDNATTFTPHLDLSHPAQFLNLKLTYPTATVYAYGVCDVLETNGEYYLTTTNNETFAIGSLENIQLLTENS